ncbi:MAG: hypothetical protein ACRELB_15920 [Polyangiaceae bacterium]
MFDHLVGCGGETENERVFVALLLTHGWIVAHSEDGFERYDLIKKLGFAGDAFPAPILRDYSYGCKLDVVFRFPLRVGGSVVTTPFAMFSQYGPPFAISVDGDPSPESAERDRIFAASGWTVLRFSDLEMQRDPGRVVCEAVARVSTANWVGEEPDEKERAAEAEQSVRVELQNYDSFKQAKAT